MRWTLAQTFNTILVSSIVTSVAGSPIPVKNDSVDLERREPAKQRPRPAALKLPARKAPVGARVNKPTKRTVARSPVTPRARSPATPRGRSPAKSARSPSASRSRSPAKSARSSAASRSRSRSPAKSARSPTTPRGRTPVKATRAQNRGRSSARSPAARNQRQATPSKRGARSVSPVRRTNQRAATRRAPASPRSARTVVKANAGRRRATSPTAPRVRKGVRTAFTRKPQARLTRAGARGNTRAARRAGAARSNAQRSARTGFTARSAGSRSQRTRGGALCKRSDDGASCSFPPTEGPGRPGPDKKITAKNIKDGKPEGWRSPLNENGKPQYKNWYLENADKRKAAWDDENKAVVTVESQPPKSNVEHRNEVQGYAQAITNIKDDSGNQRYDNFKQLPHVAYDTVVKNANGEDNLLYMSDTVNQKKGRAYNDAFKGKNAVVIPKVADFVEFNKDHASSSMGAMDKDWKKIQQDHPDWKVGDAEFEKTEREASARISRRP